MSAAQPAPSPAQDRKSRDDDEVPMDVVDEILKGLRAQLEPEWPVGNVGLTVRGSFVKMSHDMQLACIAVCNTKADQYRLFCITLERSTPNSADISAFYYAKDKKDAEKFKQQYDADEAVWAKRKESAKKRARVAEVVQAGKEVLDATNNFTLGGYFSLFARAKFAKLCALAKQLTEEETDCPHTANAITPVYPL